MVAVTDATPPESRPHRRRDRHEEWELLRQSAIEAELATGRREKTDDQLVHSLAMRMARLVAGWLLVLLGLAGLVLPGPGWLIVILGLSLLPYRWAEQTIRIIRRRIPGIPEDGRIPTRTWVIMGVMVVASLAVSTWWGLRGDDDTTARSRGAAAAEESRDVAADDPVPTVVSTSTGDPSMRQLSQVYGEVTAAMLDGAGRHVDHPEPCTALRDGDADVALLAPAEATACFGGADPVAVRASASAADVKLYGPLTVGGVDYWPAIRHAVVAADDEPVEMAIDGVSAQISAGAAVDGEPAATAESLMTAAGVGP